MTYRRRPILRTQLGSVLSAQFKGQQVNSAARARYFLRMRKLRVAVVTCKKWRVVLLGWRCHCERSSTRRSYLLHLQFLIISLLTEERMVKSALR